MHFISNRQQNVTCTILSLIGLILITGCGGAYLNNRPVITQESVIQPTQGLVVARVINTSSYPLPFNNLTIAPENLNESKKIKPDELQALTPYKKGNTIFASQIPPGHYSLKNVIAWHFRGEYRYSYFIPADTKMGTFEVKAGQVTDLGSILYYPKPQDDKFIKILSRIPETANGDILAKYFPFYEYQKDNIITWKEDGLSDDRYSLLASIAQNPLDYKKRYLSPDNSLYFLSKLGVIVKRSSEGEWTLDAVDTNLALNTIAQNEKGDLIVGGSEGKIFWKPLGEDWIDISLPYEFEINELAFFDNDTIDMVTNDGDIVLLYRAKTEMKILQWEEMNRFKQYKGWSKQSQSKPIEKSLRLKRQKEKPNRIVNVAFRKLNEVHFLDISAQRTYSNGAFSNYDIKTFAYHPKTMEVYSYENTSKMSAVIESGNATLGIEKTGFWDWDGLPDYFRFDPISKAWIKISRKISTCENGVIRNSDGCPDTKRKQVNKKKSFKFNSLPYFKNDNEAIVIASFSSVNFWNGQRSSELKILSSNDGGKTWLDTGNKLPFDYCGTIIKEIKDRILLSCNGVSTDFYESFDDGANWQHVRQQENF